MPAKGNLGGHICTHQDAKFHAGTNFTEMQGNNYLDWFVFFVRFSKMYSPRGLAKEPPKTSNIQFWGNRWIYNGFKYVHMQRKSTQKTPPMHLSTSPTCFEGLRGRKTRFRGPGPGIRV